MQARIKNIADSKRHLAVDSLCFVLAVSPYPTEFTLS